jgi:hypothetical protein
MFFSQFDLNSFLKAINFAVPTWDLFIIIFFLAAVFLYGLTLGRDRVLTILISMYMALAVINTAPYLDTLRAEINVGQFFAMRVIMFLSLFVFLFFLIARSALLRSFTKDSPGSWSQVFVFSVLHVGLLTSITMSFLPKNSLAHLAPITQSVFISDPGRLAWLILPIIAMIFMRDKHRGQYY